MRIVIVTLLAFITLNVSAQRGWGNDTITNDDSVYSSPLEYREGTSITAGMFVTGLVGYEIRVASFYGQGRAKVGFNMGVVNSYFSDSIKVNNKEKNPYTSFGAIGFGLASRVYSKEGNVHLTTMANYMLALANDRFKPTSGINLKMVMGISLNKNIFLEAGFSGQAFFTEIKERPANFGVNVGLGIML